MIKPGIGDVLVHHGRPPDDNPYRGHSLMGQERADALRAFRAGDDTEGYTFWYAPSHGGAYEIRSARHIDWRTMG